MPSLTFATLKPVWFRAWIVASVAWASLVALWAFPSPIVTGPFQEVESVMPESITELRRPCTGSNHRVNVRTDDGLHAACFRGAEARDTYFEYFARASQKWTKRARQSELRKHIVHAFAGSALFALIGLAAEWILRGAGKSFLFAESVTIKAPRSSNSFARVTTANFQAAVPIIAIVAMVWTGLPLIGVWQRTKEILEAFGPEAAGSFILSGAIVLLYRKTIHPLVTAGAILIYIPPAALIFYAPLHSKGLDFLLIALGVLCAEVARYAGSNLTPPNPKYSRFGWQLLTFIASFFAGIAVFSFIIYI